MSKRNGPPKASGLVAAAAAAALLLPLCYTTGDAQSAARRATRPAVVNPKTAAVRAATAEVLKETSEIRQLPVLRPVRSGAQSREEIEQMLVRNLNENTTPEELRASERTLKKLGLVPPDFQLRPFMLRLLVEQVAGYYDPRTKGFYLADWIDLDGQRPVMAHELTHALQDQHFNLRRFEKWPEHDSDAELAAHALIEGDAMVLMTQYVVKSPARQLAMIRSFLTGESGSTEQFDKAPRVLRESLLFPYTQGSVWAGQVYKRGGWEAVSRAYTELPASTEQILHPEKYFAGEAPSKIAFKDVSAVLGRGWQVADHDVNGEWGYFLVLDEFLKAREASQTAAAGWQGDRFALYLGPAGGDVLLTHQTAWDTEQDAAEFFEAYAKRTSARYKVEPSADEATPNRRLWATGEGSVLMELNGKGVLIVEGAPDAAKAEAVVMALAK
ncbi:MAG TPA: hypothetical protein VE360_06165 [Pyrinomonadaceae bacterium]|nr:hypothetical protein [Pyrinomonadaceae bacterium]